ncbi:hypothetical protein PCANC_18342 [Puccinia coronata f. sp. avenae]|uniref:Uncharacterized protein n=1 Tax=Puccinia coronata f. sp. avenae TaxID=200324 RepID=A0A2N5SN70_9BASI|nr:hypothetical protein PCANC_18342 [Puccinia coronata f. sp. avenae]
MAASKFISDAAIQFKLGRAPPSESLTDSNSAARAFGHQVGYSSDPRFWEQCLLPEWKTPTAQPICIGHHSITAPA